MFPILPLTKEGFCEKHMALSYCNYVDEYSVTQGSQRL